MTTARSVGAAGVGGWLAMVLLTVACGSQPTAVPAARASGVTALVGGRVQPSPDAATIADGVVLISQGVITAVGTRAEIAVPPGAIVIDCAGTNGDERVLEQPRAFHGPGLPAGGSGARRRAH